MVFRDGATLETPVVSGDAAAAAVVLVLGAGGLLRVARRLRQLQRARAERQSVAASPAHELRFAGGWRVPIHLLSGAAGTAFTGGIWRPFVAFPARLWSALAPAERHFFLRVDGDGVATSLDGKTFGENAAPGSFRIGVGVTQQEGVRASVLLSTPTRREPGH